MIHTSLLTAHPDAGTHSTWHYDDVSGEAHIVSHTNVGSMMERNQEAFKAWNDYSRLGDLFKCGSIPLAKMFALQRAGIISETDPSQKTFWKWARENYQEYSKWFTVPKRVL